MSKMIQVRNVPDRLHRELVRRAKQRRQTLSDFITNLLEREVSTPMLEEVIARLKSREPVRLSTPAADIINEEREARDDALYDRISRARGRAQQRVAEPAEDWQA